MTIQVRRVSPVFFPGAVRSETINGFETVLEYEGQGQGPWLVDLSHATKWDIQDRDLSSVRVWGMALPAKPGECVLEDGRLIARLNRTQAAAWDLSTRAESIEAPYATDITDGKCLLAVVGPRAAGVMERITALDLFAPRLAPPLLIQGPVLHVPCQVVRLEPTEAGEAVLMAFSRGYGQSMAEGILSAGSDLGLRPGGVEVLSPGRNPGRPAGF